MKRVRARVKPGILKSEAFSRPPYPMFKYGTWIFIQTKDNLFIHERTQAYFRADELDIVEEIIKKNY